ncbi:amino acid ABC transporter membrane protein (PAAT family) [Hasllibacter halocynthiae]|uniref:Amino acid ABC transporter membrane protein (PAAT family) n=1 Tax=Hasllibacter halocynthiae TaxID=595589 RepID=A0A2T0X1Z8_9RHOB|nr:amino acid ABC transporter permease [Hasllibacter halocynthiae]PRY92960.1 amino acid ABC transporter membrane protein (PAAT family) [Hasllibacter halocynthiae]
MSPAPGRDFPWWLLAAAGLLGAYVVSVWGDPFYVDLARTLLRGVWVTLGVTGAAFVLSCLAGMGLALMSLSRWVAVRQVARFYVEIVRGVPVLVLLLYVAFVGAPALVAAWNWVAEPLGLGTARNRDFPLIWRAILALAIGYAAFLSEVFRAGILSVEGGQIEAAKALGLRPGQRFRHVVLPQAVRTVLPPLGNDFVALVKDSSLVSVLGVLDVTQLGKVTAVSNFRYLETYNMVALIYLTLTITLSILLRRLEGRLRRKVARGGAGP